MNRDNRLTIVAGTNRENSNTALIAKFYARELTAAGADVKVLDLKDLPRDFIFTDMYGKRSDRMSEIIDVYLDSTQKFTFVIPEYNGGFPGVLKAFIDSVPPSTFHGKKAGLIGLASGHAGGLRPVDQFTNLLNYLQVNVLHLKPKLSNIEDAIVNGELEDTRVKDLLKRHADLMLNF